MSTAIIHDASIEEYCALEFKSPLKHEFVDGAIFMMRRANANHCTVALNVACQFRNALKECDSLVFISMMRVLCPTGLYTYPDVMATRGKPSLEKRHELETVTNPSFIAEIFSQTTEEYDCGKKFENYRTIPSLRSFMLVAEDWRRIEIFTRQSSEHWQSTVYEDFEAEIKFPEFDVTIPLAEIYKKIDFSSP